MIRCFCRDFEKNKTMFFCKIGTFLIANDSSLLEVGLVTYEHYYKLRNPIRSRFIQPSPYMVKSISSGNIVDEQGPTRLSVVTACYTST